MTLKKLKNINGYGFSLIIAVTFGLMQLAEMTGEPPLYILQPLSIAIYIFVLLFFANTIRTLLMRRRFEAGITYGRLARDIALSMVAAVVSGAGIFHFFGYTTLGTACKAGLSTMNDALYLASVTFTTLGYGDFLPCPGWSRFASATLSLFGNLHLAFLVSLVMVIIGEREAEAKSRTGEKKRQKSHEAE
ncbi:two pore domain potassium channel family protein [Aureimonas fodinaquatilis]|nr:two pore domain potassium channel family protein [Aureimonas fodinaquatilis]